MQKNDRFGREWSSSSSIQEYPSDSQAQQGLSFLGSTPPSFNLHDAMFMANDWKDNWLFDQIKNVTDAYGQTLDLSVDGDRSQLASALTQLISNSAASQELVDAGQDGNKFVTPSTLTGKTASDAEAQSFASGRIIDGAALKSSFQGINQGTGQYKFQKLPSGVILQWGSTDPISAGQAQTINLPISYTSSIDSICLGVRRTSSTTNESNGEYWDTIGLSRLVLRNNGNQSRTINFIVIGR